MRPRPDQATGQQPARRHLVDRIDAGEPPGEQTHTAKPRRPRATAHLGQARVPAQEQRRIDMRCALLIREPGEAAQDALAGGKVIAEATADAQIAIELGREAHCTPPATGHGIAIDRRPSMSSRAYIIVDDRERCRSTSPISSSDAPAFTSWVARL